MDLTTATEKDLREFRVETPADMQALMGVIEQLAHRDHDYGTCVYAMSIAATAAFRFMANRLGVTGFQASCADLDIVRRTRQINGPFMLIEIGNALYPQYDLHGALQEALDEAKPWLADQARARLAEKNDLAHPEVKAHWQRLADASPPSTTTQEP